MAIEANERDKPMQNGFIESFNGRLRDECLNEHLLSNLNEARQIIKAWRVLGLFRALMA